MVAGFVCVRGLGSNGVLFFWIAPVAFTTRGRCLTFNIARVLARAPIDEPGFQPTNTGGPHNTVKSVLSCPNVALSPPHMCHRRRTGRSSWARTCSRKWSFLLTLPHLGAPVLIWSASTEMQNTNCNNFTSGNHVRGVRFNAYFALSWRPQRATNARLNPEVSKLATITPHMRKLLLDACETRFLRPAGRPGRTC